MPERLIKRFERSIVHAMQRIGANTNEFASETNVFPAPCFRYGGMPGEWRSNLFLIRESLDELERRNPRMKRDSAAQEIREITYAVVNAMRRSDDAGFSRILRWTVNQYPVPDPFVLEADEAKPESEEARFARMTEAIADAYSEQSVDG